MNPFADITAVEKAKVEFRDTVERIAREELALGTDAVHVAYALFKIADRFGGAGWADDALLKLARGGITTKEQLVREIGDLHLTAGPIRKRPR